ncbi:MAG: GNAT family N-acetyltransferase [Bacteroidia bacterium]
MNTILIREYTTTDAAELLRLLLLLQDKYYKKSATKRVQELQGDMDYPEIYARYITFLNENLAGGNWKIFIAAGNSEKCVGFIIGSYEEDADMIKGKIGKLEDWFVEDEYRGQQTGFALYKKLEEWFKEKGCNQLQSEIWDGNELSRKMHEKLGFFVTGILFGKEC